MIANLIAWSARNIMLVLIATLFAVAGGLYALRHLPLDAIPDLSDTQVIIYTEDPGQAPQVVEDQVTYPLTTAMLTVPKSKAVRGFSFFGVSFVYIIFEDGTDIYWARSRVLEYLSAAAKRLPAGVTPALGPDATGVGWVYQYAITAENQTLAQTRSTQDWALRYGLSLRGQALQGGLKVALGVDQEIGGDDHLVAGREPIGNFNEAATSPSDLHWTRLEFAVALVEKDDLSIAAIDHGGVGDGQHWLVAARGDLDVRIHVRQKHAVRIRQFHPEAGGARFLVDGGVDEPDAPFECLRRTARLDRDGLPDGDRGQVVFGDVGEHPDHGDIGET